MSALTPASEVILRHSDEFIARHVLFAGDLQDALPAQFDAAGIRVHTNQYHHWQLLSNTLEENVQFGLVATPKQLQPAIRWFITGPKANRKLSSNWRICCPCCPSVAIFLWWAKTVAECAVQKKCCQSLRN